MSDYPLKHDHVGSVVCKLEKTDFQSLLLKFKSWMFQEKMHPFLFKLKEMRDFGLTFRSIFQNDCPQVSVSSDKMYGSKIEALQAATDAVEHILRKHKAQDKLEFGNTGKSLIIEARP
ncbi:MULTISPECIES: hypothetical protein [Bacillus]|nr:MULTISPECIES: hypothetical protein [Bacillus]KAA0836824.1 hypothetical protein EI979_14810 [Bacillus paralicheniformis]KAA0839476.1 hypothetical protein EI977_12130 [Bacillus paralicheniformis]MBU5330043.1 hypothetical protein [Bacillus paralicheniformis]MBU8747393.1 hypothetical protein [Bacillus paralicheniformis]MCB6219412.1 hypothetical protein [Bacillus paralicheniformis]